MSKIKIILSILLLSLLLVSCSNKKEEVNKLTENEVKKENIINKEKIKNNIISYINNGKLLEAEKEIDSNLMILKDNNKKIELLYIKLNILANKGNYYYKEKEYSKKIQDLVKKIISLNSDLKNDPVLYYYLGYSNEIIKHYKKAEFYYNKGLDNTKDNKVKAKLLNQLGHLYDLKGDIEKAFTYYKKAYNVYPNSSLINYNIARYYSRKGKYEEAEKYYKTALKDIDAMTKSEIYYSLSSIQFGKKKADIQKSIEYAKQSIKVFPDYSMGYVALARGYYMLNDTKYNKEIEDNLLKAIKLYKYNSIAYYYLGLSMYNLGEYKNAGLMFLSAYNLAEKDIILMDNQRKPFKEKVKNEKKCLDFISYIKSNGLDILKSKNVFNKNIYCKNLFINEYKRGNHGILNGIKNINKLFYILNK